MKRTALIVSFCLSAAGPLLADGTNVLADDRSRLSYAIGMMFAERWQQQGVVVDPDLVLRGLKDVQSGGPTLMSQQDMQNFLNAFQQKQAERQQQMHEEALRRNKAEGDAFLAKNKTQPGVVALPDGLQYKVISDGDGEVPRDGDLVTLDDFGTLVDGTAFDTSAQRGGPLQLTVGRISLHGLDEALKLMKAGSQWQLSIPPELAYGENGIPPRIPPGATLLMKINLVSVQHPGSQPAATPPPPANQPLTSDIIMVPSAEELKNGAKIQVIKPEDAQKLQQSQSQPAQ